MESIQSITTNEVPQALATNQVTEILLKDGTVLKLAGNSNSNSQEKYILRHPGKDGTFVQNQAITTENNTQQPRAVVLGDKAKQHHHNFKDGNLGAFGQHYRTEYNDVCTHLLKAKGKLKQRKNYVLYVSKNCTEENNISRKNRRRDNPQKKAQPNLQNNIPQYQPGPGEKVVSTGYVECYDVPVIPPQVRLRNEQNKKDLCPDCQNEVLVNQNEQNLNPVAAEDMVEGEGEEDMNQEKLTTTVQVLVPEN
jgi:hypothetical protein